MTAQDLKNSILQLAIQGKLVEQRPEEGNTKELLEQIKTEKEGLIKEGKIKKEKSLPEIVEDEIPFVIPESWEWVRLGNVFNLTMGQSPSGNSVVEGNTGIEFHQGKVFFGENYIQKSNQSTIKPTKIVESNSVLLCVRAPVGIVNITERKICIGRGLCGINTLADMNEKFVLFVLRAFKNDFIRRATGTTFVAITGEVVKNQLIPLPPLEEQKRIVAKIEELLPYVEQYDKAYSKLEVFNKKFPTDMQKSILQYAIQGKLVEQRPEEGTAEELYQQIQAEKEKLIKEGKIKKEKPLGEITDEEIPFEIPESWKWVRLRDIGITQTGNTPSKNNVEYFGNFIPFISPGDILNGLINYNSQGLSKLGKEVGRVSETNSILQVCIGGSIGKCAINAMEVSYNQQINAITPLACNYLFVYYLMDSRFFLTSMIKKATGTATPIINKSSWESIIVPLPPLEEQKRIVEAIQTYLPYCQQLIK